MTAKPALLMLDDGTCFEGEACGACREAVGEVIFTTGMCGYQETLTDPSYYGQIVVFTAAHIGNYGATPLDDEAPRPRAGGAVFHDLFTAADEGRFPHWRASESFNARMAKDGITGIRGIDTRALTLHLRKHGSRNGIISAIDLDRASLLRRAQELPSMAGQDLARKATCQESYVFTPTTPLPLVEGPGARRVEDMAASGKVFNVAVLDYGIKRSILLHLKSCGLNPTVWPAKSTAEEILASKPDGVMLSNGPGDPDPCDYAIRAVRELLGQVPLFGICLGHQLLGLAVGGKTYKMPFGHHGINHPVKDVNTGRVSITSQNHGFSVDPDSLPENMRPTHWNLNDQTLEGMASTSVPAFSVQYHPEAAPGTWDAYDLFDRFRAMIADFHK